MRLIIKGSIPNCTTILPNDMWDGIYPVIWGLFHLLSKQDFMVQVRPGFCSGSTGRKWKKWEGHSAMEDVYTCVYIYIYAHSWVDPPSQ